MVRQEIVIWMDIGDSAGDFTRMTRASGVIDMSVSEDDPDECHVDFGQIRTIFPASGGASTNIA